MSLLLKHAAPAERSRVMPFDAAYAVCSLPQSDGLRPKYQRMRVSTTWVLGMLSCQPRLPKKENASNGMNRQSVRPKTCPMVGLPPAAASDARPGASGLGDLKQITYRRQSSASSVAAGPTAAVVFFFNAADPDRRFPRHSRCRKSHRSTPLPFVAHRLEGTTHSIPEMHDRWLRVPSKCRGTARFATHALQVATDLG